MLNYSAHAITDLLPAMRLANRQGRARDADQIAEFIEDVRRGQKFVLPDHGSLIYDMSAVPEGIEITRLPFPVTVMEVPFPWGDGNSDVVLSASRRLILAREGMFHKPGTRFRPITEGEEPNAVKIDVACWYDRDRKWILQPNGAIVQIGWKSYGKGEPKPDVRGDLFQNAAMFQMMVEPTLSDTIEIICEQMGYDDFIAQTGDDVATEIRIMAEMMTVLSCANVETEIQQPPAKLQKARAKSGKEPFYDVHMLTVDGNRLGRLPDAAGDLDGNGFRVRQHVRRGHIRRLPDGRRIWVNQTVVAAGSRLGAAEKFYKVTA